MKVYLCIVGYIDNGVCRVFNSEDKAKQWELSTEDLDKYNSYLPSDKWYDEMEVE